MFELIFAFFICFSLLCSLLGIYKSDPSESFSKIWFRGFKRVFIGIGFLLFGFIIVLIALANKNSGSSSLGSLFSRSKDDEGLDFTASTTGNYVIQYRAAGSWCNGPGSNTEYIAESMYDRFLQNSPLANRRTRLVEMRNGKVRRVISSTN